MKPGWKEHGFHGYEKSLDKTQSTTHPPLSALTDEVANQVVVFGAGRNLKKVIFKARIMGPQASAHSMNVTGPKLWFEWVSQETLPPTGFWRKTRHGPLQ